MNDYMDYLLEDFGESGTDDYMDPIKFFHVDVCEYSPGDIICPSKTNYNSRLDDERMDMETLLNIISPLKEKRSEHVFLFDEFYPALLYAGKISGNIYEVSVRQDDFVHKADMNKLDNILDVFRYTEDKEIREASAYEYWKSGTHTFSPCYEYLFKRCMVVKKVFSQKEASMFRRKQMRNFRPLEQIKEYREKIYEIYKQDV